MAFRPNIINFLIFQFMYKRTKTTLSSFKPHPHFKEVVAEGGFRLLSDAPEISADLDPEMFSLSVNKLNGRNLQGVTLEESNRLCSMESLAKATEVLSSDIEQQQKDAKSRADYEQYLKDIEQSKKDVEPSKNEPSKKE